MAAVKISFIFSDISAVSRNDKVFITHFLSVELRHGNLKGLSGASSQKELLSLVVLQQMLMNRQGKCCQDKL